MKIKFRLLGCLVTTLLLLLPPVYSQTEPVKEDPYMDSLRAMLRSSPQVFIEKTKVYLQRPEVGQETKFIMMNSMLSRYLMLSKIDSAKALADLILTQADSLKDTTNLIRGNLSMSWVYNTLNKPIEVKKFALNAYKLSAQKRDTALLASTANTLASAYFSIGQDSMQLAYLKQALRFTRRAAIQTSLPNVLANLASIYSHLEQIDSAHKYFNEAYPIIANNDPNLVNPANITFYLTGLTLYDQLQQSDTIYELITKASTLAKNTGLTNELALINSFKAKADVRFKNANAKSLVADFDSNIKQFLQPSYRKLYLDNLEFLHRAANNFYQALLLAKINFREQDSLQNADARNKILRLKEEFESELKDEQISNLADQNKAKEERIKLEKRNTYIVLFVLILVSIALTVVFLLLRKINSIKLELEASNKAKDKLFAIVAHDLRNASTSFSGLGQMVIKQYDKGNTERAQNLLKQLDTAADNLSSMLDNLLKWSFLQLNRTVVQDKSTQVSERVAHVLQLFNHQFEAKNLNCDNQLKENYMVKVDDENLTLVLRNVISNAIKFSNPNGIINITQEKRENRLVLSIQDQGIGMSPERLRQVFNLDKQSQKGTDGERGSGLGLSIARDYLKRYGGDIKIESELEKGTTVFVELPLA